MIELDARRPAERFADPIDDRFAPLRIVLRQWQIAQPRFRAGMCEDSARNLLDSHLNRIAQVEWSRDLAIAFHQSHQALDEIVDIAERPALLPLAVNSDRFAT